MSPYEYNEQNLSISLDNNYCCIDCNKHRNHEFSMVTYYMIKYHSLYASCVIWKMVGKFRSHDHTINNHIVWLCVQQRYIICPAVQYHFIKECCQFHTSPLNTLFNIAIFPLYYQYILSFQDYHNCMVSVYYTQSITCFFFLFDCTDISKT